MKLSRLVPPLTSEELRAITVAMAFGAPDRLDPRLENAKAKLARALPLDDPRVTSKLAEADADRVPELLEAIWSE